MTGNTRGHFVISLDFELMWGVRDKRTIADYGEAVANVHTIIPSLLTLAEEYGISFTFCTVGFLFHDTKESMLASIPATLPSYSNNRFNPYGDYLNSVGESEAVDKYHFGKSLIHQIQKYPEHEIGTHTYSHFFALEPGQTKQQFESDLQMAVKVANQRNIEIKSIVFPRNQVNGEYLDVLRNLGISSYRGTPESWLYQPRNTVTKSPLYALVRMVRRAMRLADAYVPVSGENCYSLHQLKASSGVWNIPASRLLRPYSKKLRLVEFLKVNRIKRAMTCAAKTGKLYHLWWHPHNFGYNTQQNLETLEKILRHYRTLKDKYQFNSTTMRGVVDHLNNNVA